MEQTFVIIKPDAVERGLIGEITTRLEKRGLKLVACKFIQVNKDLAEKHYGVHKGKPFYEGLIRFITASPVVAMVWEGPGALAIVRQTMGATNPMEAAPGTIRHDFGLTVSRNLTHASDSLDTAREEISLWFSPDELLTWQRHSDPWIFKPN